MPTAPCPACRAEIELYESVSIVDEGSMWWGMCGQCGTEVEGPGAGQVKVTKKQERTEMGWEKRRRWGYGRGR